MSAVSSDYVVEVAGVDFAYGIGEARKQALFNVSMTLGRGELLALIGPSGSGKTTLLTLIGCLRHMQEGSIRLLGTELNGADEETLIACRRRLGFIFQAHNLHGSLTASQNVQMGLGVHSEVSRPDAQAAAAHVLTSLGLGDRLDYLPANLSGGQKQRVAIARALVGNPDVIIADEPTAALDKATSLNVIRLVKAICRERGTGTILVTHDARILEHADRIVTMEDGRIVG